MLITNKGKTIKISASDMKTINRNTQGVRLQDMSDDEMISAISSERTKNKYVKKVPPTNRPYR